MMIVTLLALIQLTQANLAAGSYILVVFPVLLPLAIVLRYRVTRKFQKMNLRLRNSISTKRMGVCPSSFSFKGII